MRKLVLSLALTLGIASSAVAGGGGIPFAFTAGGGLIPDPFTDSENTGEGFLILPLTMQSAEFPDGIPEILSLQLELNGLSHTFPDDLDIFLYSPFGVRAEIMTDRGDHVAFPENGVTLIFNDAAANIPPDESEILNGTYRPEGTEPGHVGGLNNFIGSAGGPGLWQLVILDDSPGDVGSIESWTLRGNAVPEPVTLSLLALGAITVLRRRRA